jgi:hypothetical protein
MFFVEVKIEPGKEREGTLRVAELMYESLRKLPEEERQARVQAIQKIKVSRSVLVI